jgi:hypothetical protein
MLTHSFESSWRRADKSSWRRANESTCRPVSYLLNCLIPVTRILPPVEAESGPIGPRSGAGRGGALLRKVMQALACVHMFARIVTEKPAIYMAVEAAL